MKTPAWRRSSRCSNAFDDSHRGQEEHPGKLQERAKAKAEALERAQVEEAEDRTSSPETRRLRNALTVGTRGMRQEIAQNLAVMLAKDRALDVAKLAT